MCWYICRRHVTFGFCRFSGIKDVEGSCLPSFHPQWKRPAKIIEHIVNAEMRKRRCFPLEWGGHTSDKDSEPLLWRANVAASNCYAGAKENICFHSDQLTHLGPYPTIASLSLGEHL